MQRGEIWLVNLDPALGSEADKIRPALVVSNDRINAASTRNGRGVVTVCPVTTNTGRIYPFQVRLYAGDAGLDKDSKIQAEQIRSVDVVRLIRCLGSVQPAVMTSVAAALRLHLAL